MVVADLVTVRPYHQVGLSSTSGLHEHLLSRERALAAYTTGSARLTGEEGERGHLRVGALADFAVLDADYLTVAVEDISAIGSVLTVVGGRHVCSTGAVARET